MNTYDQDDFIFQNLLESIPSYLNRDLNYRKCTQFHIHISYFLLENPSTLKEKQQRVTIVTKYNVLSHLLNKWFALNFKIQRIVLKFAIFLLKHSKFRSVSLEFNLEHKAFILEVGYTTDIWTKICNYKCGYVFQIRAFFKKCLYNDPLFYWLKRSNVV